ncbi:DUF6049 family protein [Nonomuraea longicatena]|uniref:DUF6049 family protein n=1 Tax=Nonomuraea longicatena TaxID=83682 RepID=A0ABN1NV47_9ACTN
MIRKATLLAVLSAALLAPTAAATPSEAAVSTATVTANRQTIDLSVQAITPELPRRPNDVIKVSGTIRNGSTTAQSGLQVRVRYSEAGRPLTDRAALATFAADQDQQLPNASPTSSMTIPALEPGATAQWQFTMTPAQLRMQTFGVYPITVELVSINATWQPLAKVHTFVTFAPLTAPKLPRNRLAVALPLLDQPHRSSDGTFLDDRLSAELKPGGRLADLAQIAKTAPKNVTWFMEPGLFDDLQAMSSEYVVKEAKKPANPAAAAWLGTIRESLADVPVVAVPYADPDVTALAHQGFDAGVDKAITVGGSAAGRHLGRVIPTNVNWPVGGKLDDDALDLLSVGKVGTVLLNPANVPPAVPPTTTLDGATTLDSVSGPVTALLPDEALSQTFELDGSAGGGAVINRQRFIAETAVIAAEPGQVRARNLVVAPSRRWNPDPALVSSLLKTAAKLPWLTPVPLGSMKAPKVQTPRGGLYYTEQDQREELSKKYLDPVKEIAAKADLATQITTDRKPAGFDAAVLRLTSAAWRTSKSGRTASKQVKEKIDERLARVTMSAASRDQSRTLAGVDGQFPISVRNQLSHSVTLLVDVTANNHEFLEVAPDYPKRLVINPGQSGVLQVPMNVKTSGDSTVTVRLKTESGLPYGEPVELTIRTTGYTGIALVIVGGALTVMLAAVVTRILRVRSKRRPARGAQTREGEKV